MPYEVTKRSDLAEDIPEQIAKEVELTLREKTFLIRKVNRDFSTAIAKKGETVKIQIINPMTVVDMVEGEPFTPQKGGITPKTVPLSHYRGVVFAASDLSQMVTEHKTLDKFRDNAVIPLVEDVEKKIYALHSSFSNAFDATGTNGNVIPADIVRSRRILEQNKAPANDRALMLSQFDMEELLIDEKFIDASRVADQGEAVKKAYLGTKYGFDIFDSNLVPQVDDTGNSQYVNSNIALHPNAISLVTRSLDIAESTPGVEIGNIVDPVTGLVIRQIISYSHERRSWIVSLEILYGVDITHDEFGVVINSRESYA